jgi:hypothetical protein
MNFLVLRDRRQWTMGMTMAMAFAVMMMVAAAAICARFRLELRTFLHDGSTQAFQHLLQHAVLVNAQKAFADLGLGMPVTKMESAPEQVVRRIANYTVRRFLRRHNLDHPAVIPPEQIIVTQHRTPGHKNGYLFSGRKRSSQSTVFAKLVGKYEPRENRVRMLYF